VIETSTLVNASVCWKYEDQGWALSLEQRFFKVCNALLEYCKNRGSADDVIITKTVEDEAKDALEEQ
jgi:hypothetical protein